jgi:PAS domain S-box-containing protein
VTDERDPSADAESLRRAYDVASFVQQRCRRLRAAASSADVLLEFQEAARQLVGSVGSQYYVRDRDSGAIVLHNRTGDTAIRRAGAEPWRPPKELLEWAAKERRTSTVPGASERDWHVLLPLVTEGGVSGILVLDSPQGAGEIASQTLESLTLLAEEAAAALVAAEEKARRDEEIAAFQRERAFLSNVLDSITNGILVVDLDNRILNINRNAAAMLDIATLDVIGQEWEPLVATSVRVELRALLDETIQQGFAMERLFTTQMAGADFPVAVGSSLLRDDAQNPFAVILIARDMTASREMDRLRKLDQMKSDFVANVSHELRTPLTSIKAYCEALQGMAKTAQEREFLGVIEEEGDRLLALIEDLLNLSRLQSGKLRLRFELVHPAGLVTEVVAVARVQSDRHRIVTQVEPDIPPMILDRNRIKEALINLVSNAIKYSPDGGTVTLSISVQEGNLRMDVADEGIGISEQDQQGLFQQFYRVDGSLEAKVSGTGLGLAIVKGIAEAHGGAVAVRSTPGKGSVFTILVPVRKEPPKAEEPA